MDIQALVHSIHEQTNDNGERLIQLAQTRNLEISSTKFHHKEIHEGTWTIPGEESCNQIDHVLMYKRSASSVVGVRAFRGPNCDSDHYLFRVKLWQKISSSHDGQCKKPTKWAVASLRDRLIKRQYKQELHSRIEETEINNDMELEWDNIKNITNDAANQVLGIETTRINSYWFDDKCREAFQVKNEIRNRCLVRDTRASRED
jgi:hypothetical protein